MHNGRDRNNERGTSLFLGTMALVFIVPLIGLFIDVGVLYATKARLQAAVDGASLAAARALNLGLTTAAQASSAQQNAVNWFYANYPTGSWGSSNTVMSSSNVQVFDDPNNPNLRNVTVTATSTVPTYFMKWFNINSTTITASGNASRRDVVAMMVLDRSGSMCKGSSAPCTGASATPCGDMVKAAKVFTGQFAENRDYIGLISFAEASYVHSSPSQSFQTTLGYTNNSGSGAGELDNISCGGGTGTAEAMGMAYQMIYETNLPGALNVILLETDGLPNTLSMNFYDSANNAVGLNTTDNACLDTASKTMTGGGFKTAASIPQWTGGLQLNASPFLTTHPLLPNIPAGMIGAVASSDPGGTTFWSMINYWTTYTQSQSSGTAGDPFYSTASGSGSQAMFSNSTTPNAKNCSFLGSGGWGKGSVPDIAWFPATDIVGNQTNPSAYTYLGVTTDGQGHIKNTGWSNYHNAVLNATENSAYQARSNTTLPATIYAIGLGGNSAVPPDPVLLQRMANDPNADTFNATPAYPACSSEANCQTFPSQPQGKFIYATSSATLGQAFNAIASQVLRLSK